VSLGSNFGFFRTLASVNNHWTRLAAFFGLIFASKVAFCPQHMVAEWILGLPLFCAGWREDLGMIGFGSGPGRISPPNSDPDLSLG
jgi:hypothetical protein